MSAQPKVGRSSSRTGSMKPKASGASSSRSIDPGPPAEAPQASAPAASSSGRSVDAAAPADVLMEFILEKLKLLGYENEFCRTSRPPKTPLHRLSFVTQPTTAQEQTQSYYYMVDLIFWLLDKCGLGSSNRPDIEESPNVVLTAVLQALKDGSFSASGLTIQKLQHAWGDPVCGLLDALTDRAMERVGFRFDNPVRGAEDGGEEVEVVEDDDEEEGGMSDVDASDLVGEENIGHLGVDTLRGGLPGLGKRGQDDAAAKEERTVLTARNVDADRWRAEVERQAPKLKLTTDARDWRSHVDAAAIKTGEVKKMLPESRGVLERMHTRLAEELDRLMTRERTLNDQFEALREEYKGARDAQEAMRAKYNISGDEVARLTNELQRCEAELDDIKMQLDEKGSGNSDSSPLIRTKQAIRNLEHEIRQMDVRIGVVEHACLQRARK